MLMYALIGAAVFIPLVAIAAFKMRGDSDAPTTASSAPNTAPAAPKAPETPSPADPPASEAPPAPPMTAAIPATPTTEGPTLAPVEEATSQNDHLPHALAEDEEEEEDDDDDDPTVLYKDGEANPELRKLLAEMKSEREED